MSRILSELEDVLREEADLHARLLIAAEGKREAIIKGDLPMMEDILRKENALLHEVEAAEDRRVSLAQQAREDLGIDDSAVKLSLIISAAAEPHASRLQKVRESLRLILDELRFRTRQNGELLQFSLDHVEGFLRAIAEACTPDTGYGRSGKNSAPSGLRLLDQSA